VIFLTGASGFLGKTVLKELNKINIKVCCLSRSHGFEDQNTWRQADLSCPTLPDNLLEGCSKVIHIAGLVKGSKKKLEKTNVEGTQKLISLAKKNQIKKFVFISSDEAVFDNDPYGSSKKQAEEIVKASRLNWLIIRPAIIFGLEDTKNFVFVNKIVKIFPIIPMPKGGMFTWEPVYVKDVALSIVKTAMDEKLKNECFNIAGPEKLTFRHIIQQLAKYNKKKRIYLNISEPWMKRCYKVMSFIIGKERVGNIQAIFQDKIAADKNKICSQTKFDQIYCADQNQLNKVTMI